MIETPLKLRLFRKILRMISWVVSSFRRGKLAGSGENNQFASLGRTGTDASTFSKSEIFSATHDHPNDAPIWFHASSVGELEALWPIITYSAKARKKLVVTIFSDSAAASLIRLVHELNRKYPDQLVSFGYSPQEGSWLSAFARIRPRAFVTLKYEAWPELWVSLVELRIPLFILGARLRPSLEIAGKVCRWLTGALPEMFLLPYSSSHFEGLKSVFPAAKLKQVKDLRWDRVAMRRQAGNPRANFLTGTFSSLSKPWGVLGNFWLEDFRIWRSSLPSLKGSIWLVPHRVDSKTIRKIVRELTTLGISHVTATSVSSSESENWSNYLLSDDRLNCIVVDEVGVLAELYASADWVYVGGGFGKGVHSTIEPGLYGLPILIGPKNSSLFEEIDDLRQQGQVTIANQASDVGAWLKEISHLPDQQRKTWRSLADSRLGGAELIFELIEERISTSSSDVLLSSRPC